LNPMLVADEPGICGLLRVSWFTDDGANSECRSHVSTYVNGPHYSGMEDNDLRGFLDGGFVWGWNQPSQAHVNLGRLSPDSRVPACPPKYGEEELFRIIQRWEGIRLPSGSTVLDARLVLTVERAPELPLRIMLYAMQKDWNPGGGGTERNNVSPPKRGEVWWNDVGFRERAWGLPGAGFAARGNPDADTDEVPLADATYRPGNEKVVLGSEELARYAKARIADGKPLLFLLKLSDYHEDIPGTEIDFYSGNYGSSHCVSQRPQLVLEWTSGAECGSRDERVRIEYGRTRVIPQIEVRENAQCAISFFPEAGYDVPTIEVREVGEAGRSDLTDWSTVGPLFVTEGGLLDLRITAARNRVSLGEAFHAELRDTWVATAPPEEQSVLWTFVAPSGSEQVAEASYKGDFRWAVAFVPDEIGPWRYHWRHRFISEGFNSPVGRFDVVAGNLEVVIDRLRRLAAEVEATAPGDDPDVIEVQRGRFYRLQRAALLLQDPRSFRSESGIALRQLHNRIRSSLSGRPVPDPIPLVSSPPAIGERPKRAGWVLAARRAIRRARRLAPKVLNYGRVNMDRSGGERTL